MVEIAGALYTLLEIHRIVHNVVEKGVGTSEIQQNLLGKMVHGVLGGGQVG